MAPVDTARKDRNTKNRSRKRQLQSGREEKKKGSAGRTTGPAVLDTNHVCLIIGKEGVCAEWQDILTRYPMIDSVQREDFPDHGASFVYLAHFYRTGDVSRESACARKQFKDFFRAIEYEYDSAVNFESRWFEGIGVQVR